MEIHTLFETELDLQSRYQSEIVKFYEHFLELCFLQENLILI